MFNTKSFISVFFSLVLVLTCFQNPLFANKTNETHSDVIALDADSFEEVIADGVVIVDFYADWCGPCRRFVPTYHEVAEEMADFLTFAKLNIDEGKGIPQQYKVTSIPTLIIFKDGKEIKRRLGGCDATMLKEFIQSAL